MKYTYAVFYLKFLLLVNIKFCLAFASEYNLHNPFQIRFQEQVVKQQS